MSFCMPQYGRNCVRGRKKCRGLAVEAVVGWSRWAEVFLENLKIDKKIRWNKDWKIKIMKNEKNLKNEKKMKKLKKIEKIKNE